MNKIFCELHLKTQKTKGAKIYINMSRVQEIHPCAEDPGSLLTMNIPNYTLWVTETQEEIMAQIARLNSGLSHEELQSLDILLEFHEDDGPTELNSLFDYNAFRSACKKMGVV